MSKLDELKETKSDLKEIFKTVIYLILATLTGSVTIAYKILVHQIEAYMIIVSGVGIVIIFLLMLYALKLWNKMQKINKEMKDA